MKKMPKCTLVSPCEEERTIDPSIYSKRIQTHSLSLHYLLRAIVAVPFYTLSRLTKLCFL